jgi:hypothetical protein
MARVNHYDRKGQLLKVGCWDGWWKVMDKWRARSLRMENAQREKSTILEVIDVKIGNGFSPADYSARALSPSTVAGPWGRRRCFSLSPD